MRFHPRTPWLRLAGVGAAALAAVTLPACGEPTPAPGVATAAGGASTAPEAPGRARVVEEYIEAQRAYATCMRENGVPEFPEPGPDGRIEIPVELNRRKADPVNQQATEKCHKFSKEVPAELRETLPPLSAEEISYRRAYAKCVRERGRPTMPDPGPDGYYPEDERPPQGEAEAAASYRADRLCEPVLKGKPPLTVLPTEAGQG